MRKDGIKIFTEILQQAKSKATRGQQGTLFLPVASRKETSPGNPWPLQGHGYQTDQRRAQEEKYPSRCRTNDFQEDLRSAATLRGENGESLDLQGDQSVWA